MTESKKIDGTPWRELDYSEVLQAVKNGNNRAKTKLAWLMLAGLGDKGDGEDEAVALLEERAKDNDLDALWMLALCNEYGIGTEKDLSRAACLNRQSRKKGSALAQLLHHCGSGVLLITDKESCQELEKVLPIVRWTTVVLSFENNRDECTKKVCELLKTNTTVTELNMQWNDYWKDRKSVSEMLMVNTTLTKVDMTGNRSFGASDLSWLCRPLATNSSLTTLDLSRSWIDPERVEMLSESLKTNTTLTELYLSSNSIGDEGACKISELLMVNATLVKLMLEDNSIGDEGVSSLCESLKENTTLTELDCRNRRIGISVPLAEKAMTKMGELITVNSTLVSLSFQTVKLITEEFMESLKKNTTLTELRLQ